jgi:carbohydrate kinase (thermoresistant glucokinase family)
VIVVLMGVSGVGKTTVGRLVAAELGVPFYDADDFHPEANRRKMAAGIALTERDREPWLHGLAARIPGWEDAGGAVLACSALRRRHREILGGAIGDVVFVFLDGDEELIRSHLAARAGHYMPPSLLDSQLETLERPGPKEAIRVAIAGSPAEVARAVVSAIRA